MYKLGGIAIDLPVTGSYTLEYEKNAVMDKGTIEHVKDAAGVLSRYCDALAIRASGSSLLPPLIALRCQVGKHQK